MGKTRTVPGSLAVADATTRDWTHILRRIPEGLSMHFDGGDSQYVRFATTPRHDMDSMRKFGGGWASVPLSTIGEVTRWLDGR